VDTTGWGHTVGWAGSYEVTPPGEGCGREPTGHYEDSTETVRQPDIGPGSTQIVCGVNCPSLLAEGQRAAHTNARVRWAPASGAISIPAGRSHPGTKACNTAHIIAEQHTQPDMSGQYIYVLLRLDTLMEAAYSEIGKQPAFRWCGRDIRKVFSCAVY
jgi:hypothetical protein